ncbi:DUF4870 domain-containing protein [Candidatus Laterigemmans baculatus]|uniref:DUF4870 domain-containing protein n=1 Tax=Candidatus Laterigemmans baculatus TaxID=2770505 RepID=UPI0013D9F007|nr:DUF4870 domain-containing protein [Candidatus Laterigemmans baculatus]
MNVSPPTGPTGTPGPTEPYRTPSSASSGVSPAKGGDLAPYSTAEKNWAMAAHLVPLAGFAVPIPFFNIIAPALVWFLQRESMPLVDDQAKESLNFQITILIAGIVCFVLVFFVIGIFLSIALILYDIIMMVLAAKSVQEGRPYRYPFTLRLL